MSTVTVDLPDDVEDDLEAFLDNHPEYDDRGDLLLAFTRVMLETEDSLEDLRDVPDEEDFRDFERSVKSSREALESLLDFFGVPRRVSEETLDRIERSREQFDRGEYVALEDV